MHFGIWKCISEWTNHNWVIIFGSRTHQYIPICGSGDWFETERVDMGELKLGDGGSCGCRRIVWCMKKLEDEDGGNAAHMEGGTEDYFRGFIII